VFVEEFASGTRKERASRELQRAGGAVDVMKEIVWERNRSLHVLSITGNTCSGNEPLLLR